MPEKRIEISELIASLVERCFVASDRPEARVLLLLLDESVREVERVQIAAIKGSNGSLKELEICIEIANRDFRDLLMGTDFGHDIKAHLKWARSTLETSS